MFKDYPETHKDIELCLCDTPLCNTATKKAGATKKSRSNLSTTATTATTTATTTANTATNKNVAATIVLLFLSTLII